MGRPLNLERFQQYVDMYSRGMSTREIGRALGVSGQTVAETMKRGGAVMRSKPTCPVVVEYKGMRFSPEKDGYLRYTGDRGTSVFLHRLMWEDVHGPIPPQHLIIFKDGDRTHCKIENLQCVPVGVAQQMRRKMPEPKPCAHCGQMFGPHQYYYESPSAFAARKNCSYECSRGLLRGKPKGSTRCKRPRYRKPQSVDHRARTILELRARSVDQDPRNHMGLIYRNAANLARTFECEPAEFVGAAYIAMTEAVRTWDPSKGYRFSTHAMSALKFRTYKTVMTDKGRVRRTHGWSDGIATRSISAGEEDLQIGVRDGSLEAREAAEEKARKMEEMLAIAAEISVCGAEAIQMMARGVSDEQVGRALGYGRRYAEWLRREIRNKLAGEFAEAV